MGLDTRHMHQAPCKHPLSSPRCWCLPGPRDEATWEAHSAEPVVPAGPKGCPTSGPQQTAESEKHCASGRARSTALPPTCSVTWDNFSLSDGLSTLHVNLWGLHSLQCPFSSLNLQRPKGRLRFGQ